MVVPMMNDDVWTIEDAADDAYDRWQDQREQRLPRLVRDSERSFGPPAGSRLPSAGSA